MDDGSLSLTVALIAAVAGLFGVATGGLLQLYAGALSRRAGERAWIAGSRLAAYQVAGEAMTSWQLRPKAEQRKLDASDPLIVALIAAGQVSTSETNSMIDTLLDTLTVQTVAVLADDGTDTADNAVHKAVSEVQQAMRLDIVPARFRHREESKR